MVIRIIINAIRYNAPALFLVNEKVIPETDETNNMIPTKNRTTRIKLTLTKNLFLRKNN